MDRTLQVQLYYQEELFADDTAAVRAAFPPGAALRDGLLSAYTTYYDSFERGPEYISAHPTVATVRTGGSFSLTSNIKLENTGTVKLVNPVIEVYLAPAQHSFTHGVLIKRVQVCGTVPVSATQQVNVGPLRRRRRREPICSVSSCAPRTRTRGTTGRGATTTSR